MKGETLTNKVQMIAQKVVDRIAKENPGHQTLGAQDLEPELSVAYPEINHENRAKLASLILLEIYRICLARTTIPTYASTSGERQCILLWPKVFGSDPVEE